MSATNTPRFVQMKDGSPRLKVTIAGSMRLLKLSATAENVARRLRTQSLLEEEPVKGIMATLGQIVNFGKDESTYLAELFEDNAVKPTGPRPRKVAAVNLKSFVYICSMFCKRGPEDNFLLERLFHVFSKREDDKISMREFTSGLHILCRGSSQERLHMYFKMYDVDGGGTISWKEIQSLFVHSPSCIGTLRKERMKWAQSACEEVFDVAFNGGDGMTSDGEITAAGFAYAVKKLPKILAAFDFGIKKSQGSLRDFYG
eukprot:TRINITY_DN9383_c0_g1_i6.p1 TRINITY_DN9383_c0_g1~~TRINITY_DN9383_c0_g1_i6.p1  ORF type:complete len:258 (+),score=76.06 TRINITY_DN9383_c0_g1_i6:841-1614(+)